MGTAPTFTFCPDCESEHLGSRCGMSFIERLRSVTIDGGSLETRTKRSYYDRQALDDQFGPDRKERMLDETHGVGYVKRDRSGRWLHRHHRTGEVEPLTERKADTLLGNDREVS